MYEKNKGWFWDGISKTEGITWGGCVESVDELLRHGIQIPSLEEFENVILMMKTSEEMPSADSVARVYRALGERGILKRIQGLLVGRAKAWEFSQPYTTEQRNEYRNTQREMTIKIVRAYNKKIPIVQNMNFGHTDPQIPMPYGMPCKIDCPSRKIFVTF